MSEATKALARPLPSQDELRRIFDYNPETGELVWRHRDDRASQWNGRYAGKPAGRIDSKGYITIGIGGGRKATAHRLIWKLAYGEIPTHLYVDHINGIRDDNRLKNLRLATNQQNQLNRACDKGRGYKGVYQHKNRWKAEISTPEGRKYLGLFRTPREAALAYDAAAIKWHGVHAKLNFPVHEPRTVEELV